MRPTFTWSCFQTIDGCNNENCCDEITLSVSPCSTCCCYFLALLLPLKCKSIRNVLFRAESSLLSIDHYMKRSCASLACVVNPHSSTHMLFILISYLESDLSRKFMTKTYSVQSPFLYRLTSPREELGKKEDQRGEPRSIVDSLPKIVSSFMV